MAASTRSENPDYLERELNGRARSYLFDALNDGMSLGKALIDEWPLESCTIKTCLPKSTPEDVIYRFEVGGVAAADATLAWLCGVVQHAMNRNKCLILLQNCNARRGDPSIAGSSKHVIYHHNEVLHRSDSNCRFDKEQFVAELKSAHTGVWLTGVITPTAGLDSTLVEPRKEISDKTLRLVAGRTSVVFVAAYDGEGYFVAHRTGFSA